MRNSCDAIALRLITIMARKLTAAEVAGYFSKEGEGLFADGSDDDLGMGSEEEYEMAEHAIGITILLFECNNYYKMQKY